MEREEDMNHTNIKEALNQYAFKNPIANFIRHNENITVKVTDGDLHYVLRIHSPVLGYTLGVLQQNMNGIDCLKGEIDILLYLHENTDFGVQVPVANKEGEYISILEDGTPATLLQWIEGSALDTVFLTRKLTEEIGWMTAHLQYDLKNYLAEKLRFKCRYHYDYSLVESMLLEMNEWMERGHVSEKQGKLMRAALKEIQLRFCKQGNYSCINRFVHADLSPSNLILQDDKVIPIDFSLSGYGHPYVDLGSLLCQFPKHEEQRSILLGYEKFIGYHTELYDIEPYYALQILLYIVCQHTKIYMERWFQNAMKRWCSTVFVPLAQQRPFLIL